MDTPIIESVQLESEQNPHLNAELLQRVLDSKATLQIYGDDEALPDGSNDYGAVSLPTFSHLMRSIDTHPRFTKIPNYRFRVQKWIYKSDPTDEEAERRKLLQLDLWQNCGRWMTTLELVGCQFWDIRHFRDILFLHTPNLQELQLRGCRFHFPYVASLRTSFPYDCQQGNMRKLHICENFGLRRGFEWNEIFAAFPNLNTLAISDERDAELDHNGLENVNKLVTTFAEMREWGVKPALKHLDITGLFAEFYEETVVLLRRARLQLETLKVDFVSTSFPCIIEDEVVADLLALQAPTLRTLDVKKVQVFNEAMMGGVGVSYYGNLKELRVHVSGLENFQTFSFLKLTPALQLLHIHHDYDHVTVPEIGDVGGSRLKGLVELHTNCIIQSPEEFARLTAWMPNMARVKMPLTKATFAVMVAGWSGTLTELHIISAGGDDEMPGDAEITGIPRKMLEASSSSSSLVGFENFERTPNNITDLTALEKFSQDEHSHPLSKHSLIHGFSHLANLKSLKIYVEDEVSSNMMQNLKEKIQDLRLIRVQPMSKKKSADNYEIPILEFLFWMIFGLLVMLLAMTYIMS